MMREKRLRTAGIILSSLTLLLTGMVLPGAASAAGTGPDDALPLSNEWAQLGGGESRWYAFYYAGDDSQIEVQLQTEAEDSVGFAVWTPEEIWYWGLGEYVEPVGRDAAVPNNPSLLIWSGSFPIAGTYYIVVENSGSEDSYYQLGVSGEAVAVSEPTATPVAEPVMNQEETAAGKADNTGATQLTGTLVFQTTFGGTFYTINVDGTNLQAVINGIDPIWSPDGDQIAYARWEDPQGIWVVDADGTDEQRVFDWPRETRYPSWLPDGQQIVFVRQHRGRIEPTTVCFEGPKGQVCHTRPPDPHYNLGVVRASDGSFWEPLPSTSERSLTSDWSPDGESIVYQDVYGLYVQSVDGQTRYQLTAGNLDTTPVWSPDGTRVAYVHRQHDHWEIYVVNSDGSGLARLTDSPTLPDGAVSNSVSPTWSPDGNYIAFLTDRNGAWEIWVMEADGSNQQPLFDAELDGLTLEYAFQNERAISWTE